MKTKIFIVALLVFLASCTPKQELTQQEKDLIKKEVNSSIQTIFSAWQTMDINKNSHLFLNTSEFTGIGVDGSILNYDEMIKMSKETFDLWSEFKTSIVKIDVKIITSEIAIATVIYRAEAKYKTGQVDNWDSIGSTFVLKKINNEWKVIHFQESSMPPKTVAIKK